MSIETARITKIYKSDKNKEGKPFLTKDNKPFFKVAIQTDKFGDEWFSSLSFSKDDGVMLLKEGDEKLFMFWEQNGYKNFKIPSKSDVLETRVESLESKMKQVVDEIKKMKSNGLTSAGTKVLDFKEGDIPSDDIDPNDIPF